MVSWIPVVLLGLSLASSSHAFPDVNERFCMVMRDWKQGKLTPAQLCRKYGASCDGVSHMGQAICAATGGLHCAAVENIGQGICRAGGGIFCRPIKTISGGLCAMFGDSFCPSRDDEQLPQWERRLANACPGAVDQR